jgi:hypothetical protein
LPVLPLGNRLPWVAAAVGAIAVVVGLVTGDRALVLLGAAAVAGVVLAFPIASRLGAHHADEPDPPPPPSE